MTTVHATAGAATPDAAHRRYQVAIVGTFDLENFGDLLFPLLAEHALAQRLGAVDVLPFSYHARDAAAWPYAVTSVSDLPLVAGTLDAILIGGGFIIRFDKLVAHGYGPPTPAIHHPTGYWLTPALVGLQHGIPVAWNAPGMHCNDVPEWAAPLLQLALANSAYVAVRDALTRNALAPYAGPVPMHVVPDTAFGIAPVIAGQPAAAAAALRAEAGLSGPYIVVHAIHGLDPFIDAVLREPERFSGYQFLLLPIGPVLGDDASILGERLPRSVRLAAWPAPLLLAAILAGAQAVVGHSYHLAIVALASGVPVFCSADLRTGKYTALAAFDDIHALPQGQRIDAHWLADRIGRRSRSPAAYRAARDVDTHWDRIAALIGSRSPLGQQALGRYLQALPGVLEQATDEAWAGPLPLPPSRTPPAVGPE